MDMCANLLQSCPTIRDPVDCSLQAPLSMGSSRQEYWSGLPCPPPADLPDPGIEPRCLMSPALAGGFFTTRAPEFEETPADGIGQRSLECCSPWGCKESDVT